MMDELPVEILDKLCSYFPLHDLQNKLAKLSKKWRNVCQAAVELRVSHVNQIVQAEVLQDLLTEFNPTLSPSSMELLKKYERNHFLNEFNLKEYNTNTSLTLMESTSKLLKLLRLVALGTCRNVFEDLRWINEKLKLIPSHKIFVLLVHRVVHFISQHDLFKIGEKLDEYAYEIQTSDKSYPFNISAKYAMMDVYHNTIVLVPDNSRMPCIYKIGEVCHSTKTVTLNLMCKLFLPLTVSALRVFRDRVVCVFTTGNVGIWRKPDRDSSAAELVTSKIKINNLELAQMFRINNLIVIKTGRRHGYYILDAASDEVDLTLFPLVNQLFSVFSVDGSYNNIDTIQISGNLLLVEAEISEGNRDKKVLCSMKLKRRPEKEDFSTIESFVELVHLEDSRLYSVSANSFILIPPSIVPKHESHKIKATLLMVEMPQSGRVISRSYYAEVLDFIDTFTKLGNRYISVKELYNYVGKPE